MAEKWMQAQQVDKGYIVIMLTKVNHLVNMVIMVIMLTKVNMVNMVTRCCNMTSSSNCPSVKKKILIS